MWKGPRWVRGIKQSCHCCYSCIVAEDYSGKGGPQRAGRNEARPPLLPFLHSGRILVGGWKGARGLG